MAWWRRSSERTFAIDRPSRSQPGGGPRRPDTVGTYELGAFGTARVRVGEDGHGIVVAGDAVPDVWLDLPGRTTLRGFGLTQRATVRQLRDGILGRVGDEALQIRLVTGLRRRKRRVDVTVGTRTTTLTTRSLPGTGRARLRRRRTRWNLARFGPSGAVVDTRAEAAEVAVVALLVATHAERLVAVPVGPAVGHFFGEFFAEGVGQVILEGLIRLVVGILDGL